MEHITEDEGALNRFGKKLQTILASQGTELSELADIYPVSDDDVRENLYEKDHPSEAFATVMFDKVKMEKGQRDSLRATIEPSYLRKSA